MIMVVGDPVGHAAADREAAEQAILINPAVVPTARAGVALKA